MINIHPDAAIAVKYANKIQSCKARKIDMLLSFSDYKALLSTTHCAYTGIAFSKSGANCMTIDRLDPDKPYTMGNCYAVTKVCNEVKANCFEGNRTMSLGGMILLCHKLIWLRFKPRHR